MLVHTGQDTHRTDRVMEEEYRVKPLQLMEMAGSNVVDQIVRNEKRNIQVLVLIGPGNNGGDASVVARHLISNGWRVAVLPVFSLQKLSGAAKHNFEILESFHKNPDFQVDILDPYLDSEVTRVRVKEFFNANPTTIVVDGIFGVGLSRPIEGFVSELIQTVNSSAKTIYSIDIPSGISSESGEVVSTFRSSAIKATYTVTFEAPKVGHLLCPGKNYTGKLYVTNIGVPRTVVEDKVNLSTFMTPKEVGKIVRPRPVDSHKGMFGRVYSVAGCRNYQGALSLSLMGAIHSGVGLTVACYKDTDESILSNRVPVESIHMRIPTKESHYAHHSITYFLHHIHPKGIVCIGSGMSREIDRITFCKSLYNSLSQTMVIDADGLWAIKSQLKKVVPGTRIVTPHLGEMSYLTGLQIEQIKQNLVDVALHYSKLWQTIVVLKSSTTVVADPTGFAHINYFRSSALSKAGSGDVLAGSIAGFIAQGYPPYPACILGVSLHSLAGQFMERQLTPWACSIEKLPSYYSSVLSELQNEN